MSLNNALNRLARNPRDVAALVDAGDAAQALGDFAAAEGFYRRASETEPGNGRAKAGLARALVLGGDPYLAIPLFDEALKAGADGKSLAMERGLAYDLVGANGLAQEQYRLVLAGDSDGEIRRRLALSLAIGGDGVAAEYMLMPLLRRQEKPAWRTRAFILAILGRTKEAVDVTNTLLPAELASGIVPYLRYMPQLTPAQQAAAANLGKFPRASEIGRDDPRIAAYASIAGSRTRVAAVDAALVPQGEPLGSGRKRASRRASADQTSAEDSGKSKPRRERRSRRDRSEATALANAEEPRVAPPEPHPARELAAVSQPTLAPEPAPAERVAERTQEVSQASPAVAVAASELARAAPASAVPAPAAPVETGPPGIVLGSVSPAAVPSGATIDARTAVPRTEPAVAAAKPGFDLAALPDSTSSQTPGALEGAKPVPVPEAAEAEPLPTAGQSLTELFGDLGKPRVQAAPATGAVDIRKIEPAKPKPPPPAPPKPAPPSHPSRIWVQLGIGQNVSALRYDWRKLSRQQSSVLKSRKAWVSDLGQTNRMLTGPFESRKAANDFLVVLAKAGLKGPYLWISPAGQVVEPLSD